MDTTTQVLTLLILLAGLVASVLASATARRRVARQQRRGLPVAAPALRRIPAYEGLPDMIGATIEADRPLHLSQGGAGIGGASTLVAAAAAEAFYHLARRAATGDLPPLMTTSEATALPLQAAILRRAYASRGRLAQLAAGRTGGRWYPQGDRSLAFAAALTGVIADERPAGHVLIGGFGSELALVLDAANRRRTPTLAASDQLEGQAIAYALADHALLGEELFTAPAYLDDQPGREGRTTAVDTLRWLLIAALIAGTALVLREPLLAALGGGTTP